MRTIPALVRSDTLKKVVRLSFVLPTQARGGLTTTKRPAWGVLSVWGAPGATGQPRLWRVVVVVGQNNQALTPLSFPALAIFSGLVTTFENPALTSCTGPSSIVNSADCLQQRWARGLCRTRGPHRQRREVTRGVGRLENWSRHADLNRGPADYESAALPTELCRRRRRL